MNSDSLLKLDNPIGLKESVITGTGIDKGWLWVIIIVLVLSIVLAIFISLGGINFLGTTVGDTLNFVADTVTDLGTQALLIFNGGVHDITQFILPVSSGSKDSTASSMSLPALPTPAPTPATIMPIATQTQPSPPTTDANNVQPSPSTMPIQAPLSSLKSDWCLVGEFNSRRSCVQVANSQQCQSGQLFPTLDNCLIPPPPAIPPTAP